MRRSMPNSVESSFIVLPRPIAGHQCVDHGGLERPSSPRLGPWNLTGGLSLLRWEVLRNADVQVLELA